jgi:hypothetical protein
MSESNAANAVVRASVSAAIIAAVAALALRWRARATALTWRAGFAAGLAWSVIRSLGTRLRGGAGRDNGQRPALARDGPGAQACLESVPEALPPGDRQLGEQRCGDPGEQAAADRQAGCQGQGHRLRAGDRVEGGRQDCHQPQDGPGAEDQDRGSPPGGVP